MRLDIAMLSRNCAVVRLGSVLQAWVMLLVCLGHPVAWADQLETGPKEFIESIGYTAREILQSDRTGADDKVAEIQRLLQESVDLKLTGRRVLGSTWKKATEAQRSEYSELFANYVLQIYPRALLRHQSQEFVVTGSKVSAGGDTLVFSRVKDIEGELIEWSWRVQEKNGAYKVIDLLADGISMTSTLREEFNSYVFHHGLDGLLEKLRSVDLCQGRSHAQQGSQDIPGPAARPTASCGDP